MGQLHMCWLIVGRLAVRGLGMRCLTVRRLNMRCLTRLTMHYLTRLTMHCLARLAMRCLIVRLSMRWLGMCRLAV